jgi:hypothetical protein
MREVPTVQPKWEGHTAIGAQFLDWLECGPEPATALADNIKSAAIVFAAIKSGAAGQAVDVLAMVGETE